LNRLLCNLLPRLRLIRIALTRRFVHDDVVAMARQYGVPYGDVRADIEPFAFVQEIAGTRTPGLPPELWRTLGDAADFTPADAPLFFNSEPSVGRFLGELVHFKRAKTVIELGCFVGWSTAHMALALQALGGTGRLYCVDCYQGFLDSTLANLGRHGLQGLATPVCGTSLDTATLQALPAQADVIFLDTTHAYPGTLEEIRAYSRRLAPGGCLVLHDTLSAPGVRRSVLECAGGFRILTFATEKSNGLSVLTPIPK
jgi:predicted O-methyltransferase YrrM